MKLKMKMNHAQKMVLVLAVTLFCSYLVMGASIGTFKQHEDVQLYQTCNNCTYCNFTAIKYPNSTNLLTDVSATKDGKYYYYDLTGNYTSEIGEYKYVYDCGNALESTTGTLSFTINPSGNEDNNLFVIMIFILSLGIVIFGYSIHDVNIVLLGCIGLYFVSINTLIYGINGLKDLYTDGLGAIVLGVAIYISIRSVLVILNRELN